VTVRVRRGVEEREKIEEECGDVGVRERREKKLEERRGDAMMGFSEEGVSRPWTSGVEVEVLLGVLEKELKKELVSDSIGLLLVLPLELPAAVINFEDLIVG
jgi:hypothetical protein